MRRKSILIVAMTVLGTVCLLGRMGQQRNDDSLNELQLSNVEALSQDDRPTIPCAVDGDGCSFPAKDADGNNITIKAPGYKRV